MPEGSDSKTEQATPKKRRDERKKGNVFQSNDITTVVSVLGIFMILKVIFPFAYSYVRNFAYKYIDYMRVVTDITPQFAKSILVDGTLALLFTAGPIMLTAMVIGIISSGVQTKFIFSGESLKPKFSRLSILQGVKRLISLRSIIELTKSILKIILIGVVLYTGYTKIVHNFARLMSIGVEAGIVFIFDSIMNIVLQIVLVFGVISFFDYLYQWWEHEKNLKMSKQEIKEEYKHMEGDPQVKGKIKERQRKMSTQRMMQAVPTADVVVRNPTHFAVALRYDTQRDMAPIVVAKGQDRVALRIIEIAEQNGIPLKENKPLARALYESAEPNMPIPAEFYAAMAEIMAWVYTLKQNKGKQE